MAKSAVSRYLAAIGKTGGERTSPAKAAASRENGKRGGRPKKQKKEQSK